MYQYAILTLKHTWYVFQAGRKLGLGFWRLLVHDWHKFTPSEYPHYQHRFCDNIYNPQDFARAWLHHENYGSHHWGHHIMRSGNNEQTGADANGCLPMPKADAYEMVADWAAASRAYDGSWDMSKWIEKNLHNIKLHPDSLAHVIKALNLLHYGVYYSPETNTYTVRLYDVCPP